MISPKTIKEGGAVILLRFLLSAKAILLKLSMLLHWIWTRCRVVDDRGQEILLNSILQHHWSLQRSLIHRFKSKDVD